jgi:serine protease Do
VEGAADIQVTLPDKREFKGRLIGTDPQTDLAVVKVEVRDLPHLNWGDSSKLQVGDYVLAIGNPFGLNSTVTLGIVSALGRGHMGITQYEDFIQTDAAINPGNSGGALINPAGELVGINTAILSQTGGYQGVGFAVPSGMAKPVVESLIKSGKVVRGYLGVAIQDLTPDLATFFGLKLAKGALVSHITEESPAERAGLKRGDIIIEYQGTPIEDGGALQRAVSRTAVGTKATLKVLREGHEKELTAIIVEQAPARQIAQAERESENALVGLAVQNLDLRTMRELGLKARTVGVLVIDVEPESPADRAGVAPGDVIREINRHPVRSVKDYERVLSQLKKGEMVLLLIHRRGGEFFFTLKP